MWESVLAGASQAQRSAVDGLATMRRPETAVELMQFLQAVNWLRASLPRMAGLVYLCVLREEHQAGAKRRPTCVASNRAFTAREWTSGLIGAWEAAKDLVAHVVALSRPKPGWALLTFPDASDRYWGVSSRRCLRTGSTAAFQSKT